MIGILKSIFVVPSKAKTIEKEKMIIKKLISSSYITEEQIQELRNKFYK